MRNFLIPLRWCAAAGLLLSGWLLFQKLSGAITYLVGCGAGSGCANVLGSRWSQWLLLPVTALSLGLYAILLLLTFRPNKTALSAVATSLAGAAMWFGVVQAFILKSFCPWCLAAHLIGFACALLVFLHREKAIHRSGVFAGVAATAILITGQILGPVPDTHLQTDVVLAAQTAGHAVPIHERGEGRKATFLGNKQYNVAALPHLGDPAAPNVLVEYFDYTCDSCQSLGEDVAALMRKHPGKFCVIMLPCPIDRACNPHVPEHLENHPNACSLARLSLACWRAEPASFAAIHAVLFSRPVLDPASALAAVNATLKGPLPPNALNDPWIDQILAANAEDYKRVNVTNSGELNYLMPKLLVGGTRMLHGVTRDREILFHALEKEFGLVTP